MANVVESGRAAAGGRTVFTTSERISKQAPRWLRLLRKRCAFRGSSPLSSSGSRSKDNATQRFITTTTPCLTRQRSAVGSRGKEKQDKSVSTSSKGGHDNEWSPSVSYVRHDFQIKSFTAQNSDKTMELLMRLHIDNIKSGEQSHHRPRQVQHTRSGITYRLFPAHPRL